MFLTTDFLKGITEIRETRSRRVSSWDRTGRNDDFVPIGPGEEKVLFDVKGPGCINKIYFLVRSQDRLYFRRVVFRAYWDDESTPSIEVPVGDFFGLGHCRQKCFNSFLIGVNPGTPLSDNTCGMNSYFPMPFARHAIITMENQSPLPVKALWYHVDYEQYEQPPQETVGRFHAQWRRENPCKNVVPWAGRWGIWDGVNLTGENNYTILEAEGKGVYVGFMLNVDNIRGGWWGEGDDMIFIDGDAWPPSIHGTGTEEIFGGGVCPTIEYAGPYCGFHLINNKDGKPWLGKSAMYRFFLPDPIRFSRSIRATIEHGHNNDFANDYSSVAFWYQLEPHKPFPALLPLSQRLPIEPDGFFEVVRMEEEIYEDIDHRFEFRQLYVHQQQTVKQLREEVHRAISQGDYFSAKNALKIIGDLLQKGREQGALQIAEKTSYDGTL